MAYSAGFHPHPKISYAGAAPTGAASEAEYVEIGLAVACDPDAVRAALDQALPPGLDVLQVVAAAPGSLADRLEASVWQIELPGVTPEQAGAALEAFLAQSEVQVERVTKSGRRSVDVRVAVLRATVVDSGVGNQTAAPPCAIMQLVVRHLTPSARPDDILTAIRSVAALAPTAPAMVTRLAQGPLNVENDSVEDPL